MEQKTQTQTTTSKPSVYGFDVKDMEKRAEKRVLTTEKTFNGEKPLRFISGEFEENGVKKRIISEINSNDFLSSKDIDLSSVKNEIERLDNDVIRFIVKQSFNNKTRKLIKNLL